MACCGIWKFFARALSLSLLLKISAETLLLNSQTPRIIVERARIFKDFFRETLGINDPGVYPFTIQNQECVSQAYAGILLLLTVLVLFNGKCWTGPLIGYLLTAAAFFNAELERPYKMNPAQVQEVVTIGLIVACVFMISQDPPSEEK